MKHLFQTQITWALSLILTFFGHFACKRGNTYGSNNTSARASHEKMLVALDEIARKTDSPYNGYAAKAKLGYFDQLATNSTDTKDKFSAIIKKGVVLLEYGDEVGAVSLFEQVLGYVQNSPQARAFTLYWLGTAYMRLAERENCVAGHTNEACIMPLRGSGLHKNKNGAHKAIETFETFLTDAPNDPNYMDAVWLLNIAYMALDEYPHKVPKKWLLPNLNRVEYPMKPFVDIASDLKLAVNDRAGGCIVDDFDNDGHLDIVTSSWDVGEDPMHYFKNNGDGTFTDLSVESGLSVFNGGLNIQQTDYNNDGYLDIWVLRGGWQGQGGVYGEQPNSLFRNNGDGTFTDVTIEAGLFSACPTQTGTWNDFNQDGYLDLFVGNETMPTGTKYSCELYLNNHDGTFRNVAVESGVNINLFIKGVTSGDYDNNGWPDIFISTMDGKKVLLKNKGVRDGKLVFEDATEEAGFAKEIYRSFPTFFFDYNNDGWLDLFVCNYDFERSLSYHFATEALGSNKDVAGKPHIYRNNGDGTFTDVSSTLGINKTAFAMGVNFGDFNNDGFLDIYLGTGNPNYQSIVPNKMFINLNGKKFGDATVSSRTGNLQKGHGVAIADIDNDGDQDLFVEMGGSYRGDGFPNAFYMNPGQNNNNRIYLKLEGTKSNRAGIGAKITIKFVENGVQRMVYRELNSGGSFGSSPLRREIGIGQASIIEEISITWPASGITQVLKNVKPNQLIKITEGKEGFEPQKLDPFIFRKSDGSIPMCAPAQ